MTVRVRFAPSPTGVLHIGSVRTALFNWLFARHNNGEFCLRIEDTDKLRSTAENTQLIFKVLNWLNLDWNGEPVIQSSRIERHKEVAHELVAKGKAYYCYCSPEELANKKEICQKEGRPYKYDGKCREQKTRIEGITPVIRLKANTTGSRTVDDMIQGKVTVQNSQMDDFILLRSDGNPTYMLSVVVDDHDMGITHVIRGDDHLTNTFRQIQIFEGCGWEIPRFGHIPLIYGSDGAKLSKRHGATSAIEYMQLGYLPEAILNYLLRLGWSHGDDEIISRKDAIRWFELSKVNKSPARFDIVKLQNLNGHYIRQRSNESLLDYSLPFFEVEVTGLHKERILKGMDSLKTRAKTIKELVDLAMVYVQPPTVYAPECDKYRTVEYRHILQDIASKLENEELSIDEKTLCLQLREYAKLKNIKFVDISQAIRSALCGKLVSPSVFEIISILGRSQTVQRLKE